MVAPSRPIVFGMCKRKVGFFDRGVDSVKTERKSPTLVPVKDPRSFYSCGC